MCCSARNSKPGSMPSWTYLPFDICSRTRAHLVQGQPARRHHPLAAVNWSGVNWPRPKSRAVAHPPAVGQLVESGKTTWSPPPKRPTHWRRQKPKRVNWSSRVGRKDHAPPRAPSTFPLLPLLPLPSSFPKPSPFLPSSPLVGPLPLPMEGKRGLKWEERTTVGLTLSSS